MATKSSDVGKSKPRPGALEKHSKERPRSSSTQKATTKKSPQTARSQSR